jgi:fatty-acyl-CoA synthase
MKPSIVSREVTQRKMDELASATLRHRPGQRYTVADRIEERAAASPNKPFIRYDDRELSYGQLDADANRVARVLRDAGLRTGDVAALMMENRPEYIVAWAGLAKLGVTAALVNTQVRGLPLERALEATGVRHLIVGSECVPALLASADVLDRERQLYVWPDPADTSGGEAVAEAPSGAMDLAAMLATTSGDDLGPAVREGLVAGDDLFYMFTSGTTGLPKAARLSHMRFLGVGDGMSLVAGYGADDVIACVLPLYHGAGGMVVVSCALAQGATIALTRRFSASRFWDFAREHGVTGWQYVGEICRYLLNQPPRPDDRDHRIRVMMGAGLGADVWRRFSDRFGIERILEGWSSTEANTNLINLDGRVGSCGRIPYKDRHNGRLIRYDVESETHVRDDRGFCIECAAGETGEFIGMILDLPDSGAGRFEGYASPAENEAKILRDVFEAGDHWYRSGDLLYHDEDDYFYFVDRIGDTYRWKSENVSTQEVAEVLGAFEGVEIANVYGVKVPDAEGRAGMAALVVREPGAFDGEAFYRFSSERLPSYAAPVFVRLVEHADVTSTFKLRKVDLQRDGYDPERVDDPLYVRDDEARSYVRLKTAR